MVCFFSTAVRGILSVGSIFLLLLNCRCFFSCPCWLQSIVLKATFCRIWPFYLWFSFLVASPLIVYDWLHLWGEGMNCFRFLKGAMTEKFENHWLKENVTNSSPILSKTDVSGWRPARAANPMNQYLTTWGWDSTIDYLSPGSCICCFKVQLLKFIPSMWKMGQNNFTSTSI